jgi:hypothetical protein
LPLLLFSFALLILLRVSEELYSHSNNQKRKCSDFHESVVIFLDFNKKFNFYFLSVLFTFPFVFVLDLDRFCFPQPVVGLALSPAVDSARGAPYPVPRELASQREISYLPASASIRFSRC